MLIVFYHSSGIPLLYYFMFFLVFFCFVCIVILSANTNSLFVSLFFLCSALLIAHLLYLFFCPYVQTCVFNASQVKKSQGFKSGNWITASCPLPICLPANCSLCTSYMKNMYRRKLRGKAFTNSGKIYWKKRRQLAPSRRSGNRNGPIKKFQ